MQVGLGNLISVVRVKVSDRIRFFSIDHFYLMKLLIRTPLEFMGLSQKNKLKRLC